MDWVTSKSEYFFENGMHLTYMLPSAIILECEITPLKYYLPLHIIIHDEIPIQITKPMVV